MKNKPYQLQKRTLFLPTTIALATAMLLGGGLTACDSNEEVTENQMRMEEPIKSGQNDTSDTWITTKVKTELLADNLSKGFDIEVSTAQGVVSLDGEVEGADSVVHVQQIARSVEGVREVDTSGLTAR